MHCIDLRMLPMVCACQSLDTPRGSSRSEGSVRSWLYIMWDYTMSCRSTWPSAAVLQGPPGTRLFFLSTSTGRPWVSR